MSGLRMEDMGWNDGNGEERASNLTSVTRRLQESAGELLRRRVALWSTPQSVSPALGWERRLGGRWAAPRKGTLVTA